MKVPVSNNQNNVIVNSNSTATAVSSHPKPISCTTTATTALNTNIPSFLQTTAPTASNIVIPPTSSSNTPSSCCYEPTSVLELQRSPSPAASATRFQQKQQSPPPQPTLPVPDALSVTATANSPSVDLDNLEGWDSILTELGFNEDSTSLNPKTISPHLGDPDHHHHHLPDSPVLSQQHPQFQSTQAPLISSDFFLHTPGGAADQFPFHSNNFTLFDQNPPHHNPYNTNTNPATGLEFVDDLLRAAQLVETNDTHNSQLILARLNNRLRSPTGKPFHRAAYYFKEALNNLLTTTTNHSPTRLSSHDIIQTIRAHKAYSAISPIPLFSTFTANQTILESIGASTFVHIVDFDIGFGDHWASLMREIAATSVPTRSIVLRITAVVGEEFAVESRLVTENLVQFARDLSIVNFQIDFVLTRTFDTMSFKSVKFVPGEKIVVRLTPTALNRIGSRGNLSKFVGDLRGLSANVVVLVDGEVGVDTGTGSFSLNFVAGLDFYAAVLESIDAAAAVSGSEGGGLDWVTRIETYLIRPRIVAAVESAAAGRKGVGWREMLSGYGMKVIGFSQFADVQAEFLLRRAQIGGFHVAKRQGEMLLCWHERPIAAMSAWRC